MARRTPEEMAQLRADFAARVDGGASVAEAAKELGLAESVAYAWRAKARAQSTSQVVDPPDDDDPPPAAPRITQARKGSKSSRGTKPITEATAEKLMEGMFLLLAVSTHEPIWMLDAVEKKALAEPLADTLSVIPAPIANAVNAYAAPAVLASTLVGIIVSKNNAIARQRARPNVSVGVAQPSPSPQAPQANDVPQQPPSPQRPQTDDIVDALAAAKSAFSTARVVDVGEAAFA